MTPEEFEALSEEKKAEEVWDNDEFVREWRGVCQICRKALVGTRKSLREHQCGKPTE